MPVLDAIREHAAVLARAVVLQRRVRRRRRDVAARLVESGGVRAALQVGGRAPASREHVGDAVDVPRLARMARAHQRHLRRGKAEALDAAAAVNGSACSGFSELRVNVSVYGSPARVQDVTRRSTTATAPKWMLSTRMAAQDFGERNVGGGGGLGHSGDRG